LVFTRLEAVVVELQGTRHYQLQAISGVRDSKPTIGYVFGRAE